MDMQERVLKFIADRGVVVLSDHVIAQMFEDVEVEMGAFCEKHNLSRSTVRCGEYPMVKLVGDGQVEVQGSDVVSEQPLLF